MRILATPVLALSLAACTTPQPQPGTSGGDAPDVRATSYPVWYLAKRIGAPRMTPTLVLADGADPATWQPDGDVVADLAEADLILVNGNGYESWVKTATLPTAKVVDASAGIEGIAIEGPTHSHGAAGEHSHSGTDPRVWMDPERLRQQARNVHAALVKADPAGQRVYDAQLGAVERNVDDLVAELDPVLAQVKERPVVAAHPSYTYLAARGGFELPVVDLDPEQPPTPEQVASITASHGPGTLLLWDAAPAKPVQAALPDFNHVALDPLTAPRGGSYDAFGQARLNVFALKKALEAPYPPLSDTDAPTDGQGTEAAAGADGAGAAVEEPGGQE